MNKLHSEKANQKKELVETLRNTILTTGQQQILKPIFANLKRRNYEKKMYILNQNNFTRHTVGINTANTLDRKSVV